MKYAHHCGYGTLSTRDGAYKACKSKAARKRIRRWAKRIARRTAVTLTEKDD